jgi:protoporphyrinogen oxidase
MSQIILDSEGRSPVVVVGAGPAGLSCGYELARNGYPIVVLEQDPRYVGGLARTIEYKGFRFDIGGHRFFSKNPEIEALWTELMGERMRVRRRLSRIYYRGRFFKYPLEPIDALRKLGPREAVSCLLSYLRAQRNRQSPIQSFEDWVVRAFGRRLYEIFFRSYTEKVWGVPCSEISAEWAAQRIKGLSLASLMLSLLPGRPRNGRVIKTLIDRFRYPPHGPGEVWERVAGLIEKKGGIVRMGERLVRVRRAGGRVTSVTSRCGEALQTHEGSHFISTMPLAQLVSALDPPAPDDVIASARALRYRDFITVAVIVEQAEVFPDNWIYIHDHRVQVARIQNFKNWSDEMVPDPRFTMLGLEYFCFEGDALWSATDGELVAIAKNELNMLGLANRAEVIDGIVVRQSKAYPMYDHCYQSNVARVREYLESAARNLQVAGRNGMHKYDNQDHAMLTGLMAARNVMGSSFDLWRVNSDAEYLEDEVESYAVETAIPPTTIYEDEERRLPGISALDPTLSVRDR